MKTKTFGDCCAFEGKVNNSPLKKRIVVKDADEVWYDAPFCASGGWMTIAKAKNLVRDLNKAISYAEGE